MEGDLRVADRGRQNGRRGFLRAGRFAEVEAYQTAFRFTALAPRASGWMSNETFWPSFSERMPAASTAVACTNTSLPPPSGAIKPNPFAVLKNFTVPMVISLLS